MINNNENNNNNNNNNNIEDEEIPFGDMDYKKNPNYDKLKEQFAKELELQKLKFQLAKYEHDAQLTAREQIRQEIEGEAFISNFDNKFGGLIGYNNLQILNNANTSEQHKTTLKAIKIFEDQDRYKELPNFIKNDVDKLLNLNDSERASYKDMGALSKLLNTYFEYKTNLDINNNIHNRGVNTSSKSVADTKWEEFINKQLEKKGFKS